MRALTLLLAVLAVTLPIPTLSVPPPALAARALDQILRVDMDMRGMWPYWWPRQGNFPDATEWGAERAAGLAAAWQERCRRGGVRGQVVVLAHSGGTLAAERMLQAGMPLDGLVLWSPGMRPQTLAQRLDKARIPGSRVLVVSGPLDLRQYRWFWHAREYAGSRLAGRAYQMLEMRDRQFKHATMLILGDRKGRVRGTLPGLDPRRSTIASPNELVVRFLGRMLDPRRPALLLVVGGTDTDYEPGSAAAMMEEIAARVVQGRTGSRPKVTIPPNQRQEQQAGKWRPDGRVRVPSGGRRKAA